jgi:hypothetical protein
MSTSLMKKTSFLQIVGLLSSLFLVLGLVSSAQAVTLSGTIRDTQGNPLVIPGLVVGVDDLATPSNTTRACDQVTGATYYCRDVPFAVQTSINDGKIIPYSAHYLFSPDHQNFVSSGTLTGKDFTANPAYGLTLNWDENQGDLRINGELVPLTGSAFRLYEPGTTVTLTARPFGGADFFGWSGDVTSLNSVIQVTLDADKTVTANLAKAAGDLTIVSVANGTVTRSPLGLDKGGGVYLYPHGTEVTLTAVPATGYEFVRWDGNMAVSYRNISPGVVEMVSSGSRTITPVFRAVTEPPPDGGNNPPGGGGTLGCPNGTVVIEDGAWRDPAGAPLSGNPGTPINAGRSSQYKRGCLRIGSALLTPADELTFELEVDGHGAIEGQAEAPQVEVIGGLRAGNITRTSDARSKTNITPLTASIRDLVMKLNPVSFNWKNTGEASLGLIAQEVEPLFPELVGRNPLDYQTLDYSALLAPLLVEIQAQDAELAALRERLNAIIYERSN